MSLPVGGRVACIDFGTVRIGLALSDERRILASPLPYVLAGKTLEVSARGILEALKPHAPRILLLGLPLHLNGRESPLSVQVRELAEHLRGCSALPVVLWDERLSTAQVERALKELDVRRKQRKEVVDSLSAAALLQSYLELGLGSIE